MVCNCAKDTPLVLLKLIIFLIRTLCYQWKLCLSTGKIAASSGHAAWISNTLSRSRVFELRGRSDAIIVGGNTVRRDSMNLF